MRVASSSTGAKEREKERESDKRLCLRHYELWACGQEASLLIIPDALRVQPQPPRWILESSADDPRASISPESLALGNRLVGNRETAPRDALQVMHDEAYPFPFPRREVMGLVTMQFDLKRETNRSSSRISDRADLFSSVCAIQESNCNSSRARAVVGKSTRDRRYRIEIRALPGIPLHARRM